MGANAGVPMQDRLAVVYLHHHVVHEHVTPEQRDMMLACAVKLLQQNVGAKTPLDIYIFADPSWDPAALGPDVFVGGQHRSRQPGALRNPPLTSDRTPTTDAYQAASRDGHIHNNTRSRSTSHSTTHITTPRWGNVAVLRVPPEQWQLIGPRLFHDPLAADPHYLLMGQWRLTVPYRIMSDLGYQFVLQTDDDLVGFRVEG